MNRPCSRLHSPHMNQIAARNGWCHRRRNARDIRLAKTLARSTRARSWYPSGYGHCRHWRNSRASARPRRRRDVRPRDLIKSAPFCHSPRAGRTGHSRTRQVVTDAQGKAALPVYAQRSAERPPRRLPDDLILTPRPIFRAVVLYCSTLFFGR